MANGVADRYSNRAFASVTTSAANTLTFQQLRFAVGTFQGVGLQLHRVDYYPDSSALGELAANTDRLQMAVTLRNDLSDLTPSNQAIISKVTYEPRGVPVEIIKLPFTQTFEHLPMGCLLIPANPLYLAMDTTGFAAVQTISAILYYTFKQLSDRESIELLQTIIPGNV